MLHINGTSIRLTRGDTAYLTVDISYTSSGKEYILESNDTLTLTIVDRVSKQVVFDKTASGSNRFKISSSDTANIMCGKYIYDVQLKKQNGDICTIIEPSVFEIMPEVTA